MIEYFKLILAILLPTGAGFVFVSLIAGRSKLLSDLEKAALAYLFGCGILSLTILLLGICRIKLIWPNILLATFLLLAAPLYLCWKNKVLTLDLDSWRKIRSFHWSEMLLTGLILIRAAFVLFENLIKPVIGVDAFANWSLRAKVFFLNNGLLLNRQSDFFLGGGATFYPLNIPLLQTWIYNVLGYWNDELVKIIFGLFFIALLTVFYATVRRTTSRPIALLSTYLVTTLPLLVHHATIEYADLPLAIYFTTAALFLINYCETNDERHLFLSAALAGIGTWTKGEGMPLLLVNLVVLALFYFHTKTRLLPAARQLALYFLIAMLFKTPWSVINIIYQIPKNIYQQVHFDQAITNLPRLPVIAQYFYQKMFFYGNWNIAWFTLVVAAIFSFNRLKSVRAFYSLLYIGLFLAMIAFMYYLTENYTWLLDGTTLNRNTLLIMPLVIYFIAVNLPGLLTAPPANNPLKRPKK